MNTRIKNTICVILVVILIGSLVGLYQNMNTFNEVIRQGLRGIANASADVVELNLDVKDTREYEQAMDNYTNAVMFTVNGLNKITEDRLLYKKYEMENFDAFIHEEALARKKDINERKKCINVITEIAKILYTLDEIDLYYNFIVDAQDVSLKIAEIEEVCKAWK